MAKSRRKTRGTGSESDIYEVTYLFSQGHSIREVAERVKVSRQRVFLDLQTAFREGLVELPPKAPGKLEGDLKGLFPGVEFCVITARYTFPRLAGRQILEWISESLSAAPTTKRYVAIGGGETMRSITSEVRDLLRGAESGKLKKGLTESDVCYVNATAGGQPRMPELEASQLTCQFAQAIREACGDGIRAGVAVYSLSSDPSTDELEVINDALTHTRVVVSGMGDLNGYCIQAIRQKNLLKADAEKDIAGEFLFHVYKDNGESVKVGKKGEAGIEVKEETMQSAEMKPSVRPMLATLFRFESLQVHGGATRRAIPPGGRQLRVVGVATCTPENRALKARSAYALLNHGFLTHCCLSSDLAKAILDEARRP